MSPPGFPDIRVVDDFVVPAGEMWSLQGIRVNVVEDDSWVPGGVIEVYIRAHDSGTGGPVDGVGNELYNSGPIPFDRTPTGEQYFGRDAYVYAIPFPSGSQPALAPGQYWIGFRNPAGSGSGTNWWLTSDGLPDGAGTAGWLSLDGGANFNPEGEPDWDHAFMILGESDLLWDNNLEPDGVNGRALSPPLFPDIRVVDDFVVPLDKTWVIDSVYVDVTEDADWANGGLVEVFIRSHDPNTGGPVNGVGVRLNHGDGTFGTQGTYPAGQVAWHVAIGNLDGDVGADLAVADLAGACVCVLLNRSENTCFGDLDGDWDIDLGDLAIVLAHYGMTTGVPYEDGSLDCDGDVDLTDLAALLAVYGTTCD
jgi:hypothetical protein